eukprot:1138687-Pelagomonas_calceolata.AAC.11
MVGHMGASRKPCSGSIGRSSVGITFLSPRSAAVRAFLPIIAPISPRAILQRKKGYQSIRMKNVMANTPFVSFMSGYCLYVRGWRSGGEEIKQQARTCGGSLLAIRRFTSPFCRQPRCLYCMTRQATSQEIPALMNSQFDSSRRPVSWVLSAISNKLCIYIPTTCPQHMCPHAPSHPEGSCRPPGSTQQLHW